MIKFNINDYVWVRLTDEGKKQLKKQEDSLELKMPGVDFKNYLIPCEDSDGWSRWQLWELMYYFGNELYNGCRIPFETEIKIETKNKDIL